MDQFLFRPGAESPLYISLVGGNRGYKELIINNCPNAKRPDRGDTGPLLEVRLMEEGGSGICGSAVAVAERFFMSSMD